MTNAFAIITLLVTNVSESPLRVGDEYDAIETAKYAPYAIAVTKPVYDQSRKSVMTKVIEWRTLTLTNETEVWSLTKEREITNWNVILAKAEEWKPIETNVVWDPFSQGFLQRGHPMRTNWIDNLWFTNFSK